MKILFGYLSSYINLISYILCFFTQEDNDFYARSILYFDHKKNHPYYRVVRRFQTRMTDFEINRESS